ncbi:bifunctional D-glycero-beta-D-manno-heptose-7-phosphate kinase/D-glycero-beta-D-manno-heptose 1-phosphate adenylyltransferase HldE [Pelovirga terrestris]|uniref:Bifunctional protein HldE n=1 Tax=Pelovirga terrestris TaxID=2771352 RepID=A0A8J6QZ38_9BACT|nr:bifunctional D-glycero-beta-D-manno-heptose-7-phosphate kinase/D-glycero-beta-D-manno-heptose 1-phosphate adenylyltransferase HldE [Pelovirga terrestris]MBD1401022.1 bifunctional D-glycero-beta-D-manno-heptose-7-phosphate kinase/D-glycero-beta-D-manno-heptose 1-phosphate adenylyltransferase HldE [Pelovirga terrestris]
MKPNQVESFLARLPDLRVLVIGDLMLDEYIWGRTERISPEAPVQVVDVVRGDLRLGGAGNVVNNLLTLGCQVDVISVLGEDEDGISLHRMLEKKKIGTGGIVFEQQRTTSRKTRVLAGNQQMLRIDRESREPIVETTQALLIKRVREMIPSCQVVLVSDYLKGLLTEGFLKEIIAIGIAAEVPVVIDPKGDNYDKYQGATLLTPNRKEAQIASGIVITDEQSLLRAGRLLLTNLQLDALVLTRSEEGMSLFSRDGSEIHLPTEAREVFDVSGAGDTVLALLGLGLGAGLSLADTARIANLAAGIVVGKVGTSTVSSEELIDVAGRLTGDSDAKIKHPDILSVLLKRERQLGRKIVFTNGCFDLLHVGHVKYLQKARNLGDLLILGLNSDASIRRLKGSKRPLISEEERAHLLAALKCIDYVVVFNDDTPLELIHVLRPDILVKGGDYSPDDVVGKELVESYGGRVDIIPFVDGKSTTNIIERILEQYRDE